MCSTFELLYVYGEISLCWPLNKQPILFIATNFSFRCSFEMSIWRRTKLAMNNVPKKSISHVYFKWMKKAVNLLQEYKMDDNSVACSRQCESWQNQPDGTEQNQNEISLKNDWNRIWHGVAWRGKAGQGNVRSFVCGIERSPSSDRLLFASFSAFKRTHARTLRHAHHIIHCDFTYFTRTLTCPFQLFILRCFRTNFHSTNSIDPF